MPNESRTRLIIILNLIVLITATNVCAQYEGGSEETPSARRGREEVYHESALRRFEVITLVSLPFTAIHSYLAVRGIRMLQQNEFAPKLSGKDYRLMGASAVSFSLFIGFWDWLHTHGKDPSQQLIPNSPQSPPREVGQNEWGPEEPGGLVVPLVHVRF